MQHIPKLFGTRHNTTPAFDGLTETMNSVLAVAIFHYVNANQKNWGEVVPAITFYLNTAKWGTTRYSPFELVYGRQPVNPIDASVHLSGFDVEEDPTKYANLMNQWLQEATKIANIIVNRNFEKEASYVSIPTVDQPITRLAHTNLAPAVSSLETWRKLEWNFNFKGSSTLSALL